MKDQLQNVTKSLRAAVDSGDLGAIKNGVEALERLTSESNAIAIDGKYKCPQCASTDRLAVVVQAWADLIQHDDEMETVLLGENRPDADTEFDALSLAYCAECDYCGAISSFVATEN